MVTASPEAWRPKGDHTDQPPTRPATWEYVEHKPREAHDSEDKDPEDNDRNSLEDDLTDEQATPTPLREVLTVVSEAGPLREA